MPVEDIFTIQGRGTVATGRIERGIIKVNEAVEIVGIKDTQNSVVTGVEMFKKLLDEGRAGDNVGLLLRGVERSAIERGQVIAKPGTIKPHTKFKAEAYVLTKEEGGQTHTVFHGLSSAVLFSHNGHHGRGAFAGRSGNGDAGRQHPDGDRVDQPDCDGERLALCHPRRRQNGRASRTRRTRSCTGVEMFKKLLDEGRAGDNVGLLLRGVDDQRSNADRSSPNRDDQAAHEVQSRGLCL